MERDRGALDEETEHVTEHMITLRGISGGIVETIELPKNATVGTLVMSMIRRRSKALWPSEVVLGTRVLDDSETFASLQWPAELLIVRRDFDAELSRSLLDHVRGGDVLAVEQMLRHCANPNYTDGRGLTALLMISGFGRSEMATRLRATGGDPGKVFPYGWRPPGGRSKMARLLCEWHADVSKAAPDGSTALHAAAENGNTEMLVLLCEFGADTSAAMCDGRTPLQVASASGHPDAVNLLAKRSLGAAVLGGALLRYAIAWSAESV